MQRWSPCLSNSERASPARAQPEPSIPSSSSLPVTGAGSWRNRTCSAAAAAAAACEGLQCQKGFLSVNFCHCSRVLTASSSPSPFFFPLLPLNQALPFELVSRCPPLSSDCPGSQGCTLCLALGSTTRTIFFSGCISAKLGLYSQAQRRTARRRTARQYPTRYNHQVPLCPRCGERPGSSAPFSPWSVDSGGQPPNLKSPSSCALSSRVQPILPVLPSRCQVLRVEAGPSCWQPWQLLAGPGRPHLSDSQWAATRATVHCPALPCDCTK